jgi:hypothetical protein
VLNFSLEGGASGGSGRRGGEGFDPFKSGHGLHGKLPVRPKQKYKGAFDTRAFKCGFEDKYMYKAVADYLENNGDFSLVEVGYRLRIIMWRLHTYEYIDCKNGRAKLVAKLYISFRLRVKATVCLRPYWPRWQSRMMSTMWTI